jgi:hypothetical protein
MATRSKKVSKKRAEGKATRKARAKNVRQAALVKSLSRKGGSKSRTLSRARKAGVIEGEDDQLNPRATKKWTG